MCFVGFVNTEVCPGASAYDMLYIKISGWYCTLRTALSPCCHLRRVSAVNPKEFAVFGCRFYNVDDARGG